jgi:hypothetical protein
MTCSRLASLVLLASLAASAVSAQAPYRVPRTPWGDPDLQGVWPGNMGVPMQRAEALGTRKTLTEEEYQQRVAQAQQQATNDSQEFAFSDTRVGIGPPSYWTERGVPTRQTSLIQDPPNGRLPELTWSAIQQRALVRTPGEWRGEAATWADMNIYYRCITRGLLGSVIPVVYNNGNQIVQAPGYVVFRNEMIHEARVIPIGDRPHVSEDIRMYMGDARGRWEGDTLVVETTNFTNNIAIGSNGAGYPGDPGYHSKNMKLVERFTRVSEDTLNYEATIVDPLTWTKPWTMLIQMRQDSDYQFLEYACHEGNYAMGSILQGARAEEAAAGR